MNLMEQKEKEKQYNLLIVERADGTAFLMCRRKKPPYKGLLNFVGGKIEPGESHLDAAYRELYEETGILRTDLRLLPVMDFTYPLESCFMEVFYGRLQREVEVAGEENELLWVSSEEDFSDFSRFAGVGNIYHMISYIRQYREALSDFQKRSVPYV